MALTDSLIAYFKFDETSGTTAENAANPGTHDGTLTLGTSGTLNETGKIGTAILFDNGANDFGTNHFSSSTFSSNGLTITGWFKTTVETTLFSFEGGWDSAVDADGYVNFKIDGNAPNNKSTSTVDDGNWHFFALTATSGGSCKIYVDGSTAETSFSESWYNIDSLSRGQCLPGYFNATASNGTFDEMGLWNRALSDSEIGELYNSGSGLTYYDGEFVESNPLDYKLVSYWKLDETSGTTATDSVGSNDGTNSNCTVNQAGKIDKCYDFNGSTSKIDVGSLQETNITISAWVNTDALSNYNPIISNRTGTFSGYFIYLLSNGKLRPHIGDGVSFKNFDSTTVLSTGTWYHVVMTADGSNLRLYINGEEDAGSGISAGNIVSSGVNTLIGSCPVEDDFDGKIDEVGIWSRALTSDEITALYNSDSGLTYPFSIDLTLYPSAQSISLTQPGITITGADTDVDLSTNSLTLTQQTPNVDIVQPYVFQSKSIFLNNVNILTATPSVTIDSGSVNIYLSNNGGSTWESATNNTKHTFSSTGQDLRYRMTGNSAVISKVEVRYTT